VSERQLALDGGPREGQTYRGASLLARYASFVKLPHTLFALPFAAMGAVLATYEPGAALGWAEAGWIVLAFTAARFAAMGFNRIVDRALDAENPRTAARELPAGRLAVGQAAMAVTVASAVFVGAAWMLNPLCGILAPVALAWVFIYSYTKRFTAWAHHVLGLALGIAPVGGYLGVTGSWAAPWYALPVVAGAVMFWVAGFDVIYALQDRDFDRARGLHSIPARMSVPSALTLARVCHGVAALLFLGVWALGLFAVGWVYLLGVAVVSGLLVWEHAVAGRLAAGTTDLPTVDRAFFHANVAVSTGLFIFTLMDRVLLG
jgi:4-hydroxybenzoate polyprenyltransferase